MNSEQLEQFRQNSFVELKSLFSPSDIREARRAFHKITYYSQSYSNRVVIPESHGRSIRSIMSWQNAHPVLHKFARNPEILAAVRALIGSNIEFHQTKYNPKAPGGKGEKWDHHRGFTFWHFLDGIQDPEKIISVFIALTDQTEENGAVRTWKKSHLIDLERLDQETTRLNRNGVQGDTAAYLSLQIKKEMIGQYERELNEVVLTGRAGTVWLIDSRNLHASRPNESDGIRELVANVYRTTDNRPLKSTRPYYLCEPPSPIA